MGKESSTSFSGADKGNATANKPESSNSRIDGGIEKAAEAFRTHSKVTDSKSENTIKAFENINKKNGSENSRFANSVKRAETVWNQSVLNTDNKMNSINKISENNTEKKLSSSEAEDGFEDSERKYDVQQFMYSSQFELDMQNLRLMPQEVLKNLNKENLIERIKNDTTLLDSSVEGEEKGKKFEYKEERSKFLDAHIAKGLIQEEMIRASLSKNFNVSDKTVKSVHKDGKITFTDVIAREAKQDITIGKTLIKQGETAEFESKAGDEKYLSSQINHISSQLEGMGENSHRFLVVTADFGNMSVEKQQHLLNTTEEHNAQIVVLPYYAIDLQDTVVHMDIAQEITDNKETDTTESKSITEEIEKMTARYLAAQKPTFAATYGTIEVIGKISEKSDIAEKLGIPNTVKDSVSKFIQKKAELNELADQKIRNVSDKIEKWWEEQKPTPEQVLENQRKTIKEILSKNIKDTSDEERRKLINVAVHDEIKANKLNKTDSEIDILKSKIEFIGLSETSKHSGRSEAYSKYILGFYSPKDDKLFVNTESSKTSVSDVLATVDHELNHMNSQKRNEKGEVEGLTGVKDSSVPGPYGNVGMNEGITELYSIRNMKETNEKHESKSYVELVKFMNKFEACCGEEKMRNAYFNNDFNSLKEDYDTIMGEGEFYKLCKTMDDFWNLSYNKDYSNVSNEVRQLNKNIIAQKENYINNQIEAYKQKKTSNVKEGE